MIDSNIGWLFKIGATVLSLGISLMVSRKFDNMFVIALVFLASNIILLEIIKWMGIDVPLPNRL